MKMKKQGKSKKPKAFPCSFEQVKTGTFMVLNCTPLVVQYVILSNKWGAIHSYIRGFCLVSVFTGSV